MKDPSDRSGSNAGLVIGIVAIILALPCCGGLALLGAAFFGFWSLEQPGPPQPWAPQPVVVQPAPPVAPPVVEAEEVVTEVAAPVDQGLPSSCIEH